MGQLDKSMWSNGEIQSQTKREITVQNVRRWQGPGVRLLQNVSGGSELDMESFLTLGLCSFFQALREERCAEQRQFSPEQLSVWFYLEAVLCFGALQREREVGGSGVTARFVTNIEDGHTALLVTVLKVGNGLCKKAYAKSSESSAKRFVKENAGRVRENEICYCRK